jgi:hypothetical protein
MSEVPYSHLPSVACSLTLVKPSLSLSLCLRVSVVTIFLGALGVLGGECPKKQTGQLTPPRPNKCQVLNAKGLG